MKMQFEEDMTFQRDEMIATYEAKIENIMKYK